MNAVHHHISAAYGEQTLQVEGMHCASCVARIESALRKDLAGLTDARVNFADGRVMLQGNVSVPEARAIIERLGYHVVSEQHSGTTGASNRFERQSDLIRLIVAIALTLPVAAIHMTGWHFPQSNFFQVAVLQWVLASVVLFICGNAIFKNALAGMRQRSLGMDVLIALGSGTAWTYSTLRLLFTDGHAVSPHGLYFETAAMMMTLVLLGRFLEKGARNRAADAVEALARLQPETILLRQHQNDAAGNPVESFEPCPVEQARVGDIALVRPGMGIPLDGVVLEGDSVVYESMMTGESRPVPKKPGDSLIGGTLNGSGGLIFRIAHVGEQTMLARMIALVQRAVGGKPPIQRLVDRVAGIFTPVVLGLSVLTLAGWLLTGHPAAQGLSAAIATLVVACPCALGLATPVAIQVGLGRLAREGVLIRDADALELAQRLNILVLDKTGTLTQGRPEVTGFTLLKSSATEDSLAFAEPDCIRWAAALEQRSEHPLANSIVRYAEAHAPSPTHPPEVRDFFSRAGEGVGGLVENQPILLGNPKFLAANGVDIPAEALSFAAHQTAHGEEPIQSTVYLAVDRRLAGQFRIADPIRPDAAEALRQLRRMDIQPYMLSGDLPEVALAVGETLGLKPEEIKAGVSPEEKQAFIRALQQTSGGENGKRPPVVAMAGDGVNDAPALAQADIGIAMGSGTDIAMQSAHITLLHGDIAKITTAIETGRAIVRTIRQNLFWAFFYNLLALPVAMLGGLNPMIAAAAMSLSSLMVVLNSLRLRGSRSVEASG